MHYIIGIGGGGTHLLSTLIKTLHPKDLCLIDGDTLEGKNLKRQVLFEVEDIGKKKADALATRLGCKSIARYIKEDDELKFKRKDVVFICVDNNPARKNILNMVDEAGCMAIICGNEYDSAQSYIYKAAWKDSEDDPRIRFSEITTDASNDPLKPHCEDEYKDNEQLATFNAISATFGLHLLYLWTKKDDLPDKYKTKMFWCNFNKYSQR